MFLNRSIETFVEWIHHRPPSACPCNRGGDNLEPVGVRGAVHQADILVGRVRNCVEAPAAKAPVTDVAELGEIILAVLSIEIGRREIVGGIDVPRGIIGLQEGIMGAVELSELAFFGWKILKIMAPVGNILPFKRGDSARMGNPYYSMRPEEISFRVDHPPFPVNLFDPEMAGRLEPRSLRPTAELRAAFGSGIGRKILFFGLPGRFHIFIRMDLSRPLGIFELSILVDEREELLRR